MKQLQKSNFKEGEIYKQLDFDYIFLYNNYRLPSIVKCENYNY